MLMILTVSATFAGTLPLVDHPLIVRSFPLFVSEIALMVAVIEVTGEIGNVIWDKAIVVVVLTVQVPPVLKLTFVEYGLEGKLHAVPITPAIKEQNRTIVAIDPTLILMQTKEIASSRLGLSRPSEIEIVEQVWKVERKEWKPLVRPILSQAL